MSNEDITITAPCTVLPGLRPFRSEDQRLYAELYAAQRGFCIDASLTRWQRKQILTSYSKHVSKPGYMPVGDMTKAPVARWSLTTESQRAAAIRYCHRHNISVADLTAAQINRIKNSLHVHERRLRLGKHITELDRGAWVIVERIAREESLTISAVIVKYLCKKARYGLIDLK